MENPGTLSVSNAIWVYCACSSRLLRDGGGKSSRGDVLDVVLISSREYRCVLVLVSEPLRVLSRAQASTPRYHDLQ